MIFAAVDGFECALGHVAGRSGPAPACWLSTELARQLPSFVAGRSGRTTVCLQSTEPARLFSNCLINLLLSAHLSGAAFSKTFQELEL